MRHDIQPNERCFSSKEVAEEVEIATATVRKYGQILERNGYEFFKEGNRRIFVQTDIEALIALRDTEKPLDDTAKDLVYQQKARLAGSIETEVALPDTNENLPDDPNDLKEVFMFLANELAATREKNDQLTNSVSQLKTTVSRLQQDHHDISASIGNSANKTQTKIEKLSEQQKDQYETLLQQEKQKSEYLQEEIQNMREEQKNVWHLQNEFNKKLEKKLQKPEWNWRRLFSIFRK
ncbi:hypothetical protein LGQ02_15030 [Bacillus shivajii]|uniref:hypothetical protein n=1 Tax=Bacillus shivajii TaxID=1983719 RepID=UPI001CFA36DB|nr:hypothetical protein [Bacillus shivajii]UCZ52150.1 hypothetical protein LGQ02_15030 [Bacillus shivajii]